MLLKDNGNKTIYSIAILTSWSNNDIERLRKEKVFERRK